MRESGDTYEFSYPFGFEYVYKGSQESDYALDADEKYLAALPKVDNIRAFYTLGAIKRFLYADGALDGSDISRGLRIKLKADGIYYDSKLNCYVAEITQYAGDQPIYGCGAIVAVNGNKVVYVSGNLILCNLGESNNAELRDQVNLMLLEKRELSQTGEETVGAESQTPADSETNETNKTNKTNETSDAAETSSAEPQETATTTAVAADSDAGEKYVLTSAESCYCITWNNDRSKFYLIPGWKFTYNYSVVRIRNAVNGSIYTK